MFISRVNTNNIVMWETLHNSVDWDCFKTLTLREILKTRNRLRDGTLCVFGSHTFVPISWMRKKQTCVSHSSTESEIISLDAGSRMDGIPELDLWNGKAFKKQFSTQTFSPVSQRHLELSNVDFVSSNANSCHKGAMLCIFEDNEAVIKMILMGRSPTMRHVVRTHRVALDWLFDRINFDPKIQIKYVDSENQLADIT